MDSPRGIASLGTSGTPARTLSSHSNSGDILGHTTPVKSDSWNKWQSKGRDTKAYETSGDIIGHRSVVSSDDFNHWPNHKKHLRQPDSGDVIACTGSVRSREFQEMNSRHKPAGLSYRDSGDIVFNRSDTVSDDFITMDSRLKKSPYKNVSNVPLAQDNPQPVVEVPGFRAPKTVGKKTGDFATNLPTAEDLVRTYRPQKRMLVTPGTQSTTEETFRSTKRVYENKTKHSPLSPSVRDEAAEVAPVAYLGARKGRVQSNHVPAYSDERRPSRRLFGQNPYDHGNIVQHDDERPSTAPVRFSKRIFDVSRDSESKHSSDEVLHFNKRVFKDATHSQGVAHDSSPQPAPVFAHTGYNQARQLRSVVNPARAERYKSHGDIVGWTTVKL